MIQYFTTKAGESISLNLTRLDLSEDGSTDLTKEVLAALAVIKSLSPNKRVSDEQLVAADVIYDESICLSPWNIFKLPLHRDICAHLNNISDFGWDLRESLDGAGSFAFIDDVKDSSPYDTVIERILNVFTISGTGLSAALDAPIDFIHAAVDFFRSPDGTDWNREVLVGDVSVQCVSNVVKGLAKIYNDPSLLEKTRKHRIPIAGKNTGWLSFQVSKDKLDQELLVYFREFMDGSSIRPTSAEAAILGISSWLKETGVWDSVDEATSTGKRPECFSDFLTRRNGGLITRSMVTTTEAARRLSISISAQLSEKLSGQTVFDLVTDKELKKLKKAVEKLPKPDTSRSRALPEKMIPIMGEILEEGANGWPGQSGLFNVTVPLEGKARKIYCPVIPTLFLVMLDLPLRMAQIRRLDSGEGDAFQFNADRMEWEENTGRLAGYWKTKCGDSTTQSNTRGYAREINDAIKPVTGVNVNTNKSGSPYVIPWFIPSLQTNLWNLRKWQEKYNPIDRPIGPDVYLDQPERYSEATKQSMPDIFPIGRLFKNRFWTTPGRIATHSEMDHAWCWLLYEIETRWNQRHPGTQTKLVDLHPKAKQPYRPRYNIHGLRVRGLTNLRRGGMPLDLLSKFVAGHATLRMTLYYVKAHASEIAEAIELAVSGSESQRSFIDELKMMEVDEARRLTVSLSPSAVSQAIESGSQFQFCNVSIGICPYDGSRCYDGGELLRKEEKDGDSKNTFGKIEGRNCVMCRHFLTGPPWLTELLAYGTKLCERRQFLAREQDRIDGLVSAYEVEMRAGTVTKAFFENKYDALQVEIIQIKDEQGLNESSIFNVELLCNASKQLIDDATDDDNKVMLVAHHRSSVVEFQEISEFEQSVWITALGRIHQILGDERVEAKRDKYLDLMLWNSGITPPGLLTQLSPEHRKKSMDQYALFISSRASSTEIDGLVDGTIRLQDLGLREEVQNLIAAELSGPVSLPGVSTFQSTRQLEGDAA
ncbi:putative integrase [Rhizobium sp. PP-CC-2G-626]|nr:putative integrase [Rhizobium sp. PP-CC-2G-626]